MFDYFNYVLGIESVDIQHGKLLYIVKQVGDLLKDVHKFDRYDEIIRLIHELRQYTVEHFRDEEKLMENDRYPKRFSHKASHSRFIREINSIDLASINDGQYECVRALLDFVSEWIVKHIDIEDRMFADYYKERTLAAR